MTLQQQQTQRPAPRWRSGQACGCSPGRPACQGDPAPTILAATVSALLADPKVLTQECFGPTAIVVSYGSEKGLLAAAGVFDGQLTLREDSPWRLPRRVAGVLQPA